MKIVHVAISHELLTEIFTEGWQSPPNVKCIKGLPKGAQYIRSFVNQWNDSVTLVFSHESFDDLGAADLVPTLDVVFRKESEDEPITAIN